MVIHPIPDNNINKNLYDYDVHEMLIQDWKGIDGDAGMIREFYFKADVVPDTILINGKGRYRQLKKGKKSRFTPIMVYEVKRVRFAIVF